MTDREQVLTTALEKIIEWSNRYPVEVFPIPDLDKANKLLSAGGERLDAISAAAIRHVLKGVAQIASDALAQQ